MALVDAWHNNWGEVAASVSSVRAAMTVKQCKRRMDTLKKIYNLFADDGSPRLLAKLHSILGGTDAVRKLPATISTKAQSERHNVEKSSEDLQQPAKRRRMEEESPAGNLARAIEGLAEAYEKVEMEKMEKMKQAVKMGEQWMSLVKDFESEWIKFYKKTQKEINKLNNG